MALPVSPPRDRKRAWTEVLFNERVLPDVRTSLSRKEATIVMIGRNGVGKSTLVNTLLLREECETGEQAEGGTSTVGEFFIPVQLGSEDGGECIIRLVDTPGFSGEEDEDSEIAKELKRVGNIDILLFCISFSACIGRYQADIHYKPLEDIEKFFGDSIADKTIIVLTQCNLLASQVDDLVEDWTRKHKGTIHRKRATRFENIPILVAGHALFNVNKKYRGVSSVNGYDNWLNGLWNGFAERTKTAIAPILILRLAKVRAETEAEKGLIVCEATSPVSLHPPIFHRRASQDRCSWSTDQPPEYSYVLPESRTVQNGHSMPIQGTAIPAAIAAGIGTVLGKVLFAGPVGWISVGLLGFGVAYSLKKAKEDR